jgi:hypothetical protein
MATMQDVSNTHKKIESIQNRIFNVVMREPIDPDPFFKWEETYGVFNEKTGKLLGRVGNRYSVTQPKAVFDAFCDAILKYGLDLSTLKYKSIKGGQIVRFSIKLKDVQFKNKAGKIDKTTLTLVLQIGLNGKTKTSMFIYSLRKICTNGAVANFTEFALSFKNVKGNQGKIVAMFDEVARTIEQVGELEKLYETLNKVEINQKVINLYLKRVHDIDMAKYGEYNPQKQAIIDLINNSIKLEIGRTGNTLFGLYNGTTHYANHVINSEDTDSVFTGVGSRLITKAEDTIFEMLAKPKAFSLQLA